MRTAAGKKVRCRVDGSRRVRIPAELCRTLDIRPGDEMLVCQHGTSIEMNKVETRCILCGAETELVTGAMCRVCYDKMMRGTGAVSR